MTDEELVRVLEAEKAWLAGLLAAEERLDLDAWERKEAELAAAQAEIARLRQELTDLGLREQWAALYPDADRQKLKTPGPVKTPAKPAPAKPNPVRTK